jgi:hypothetical protein
MKYVGLLLVLLLLTMPVARLSAQCVSGNCQNGLGTFVWESGDEYTGEWVNGARTGLGVYDWKGGSYYYGYFKEGKLEGRGVYLGNDEEETTLIGYFENGQLKTSDNFVKTGCILGNCENGVGVYLWESDDVYVGEWKAGNRTGYGRYDWKDGSFYTGDFKDGQLHGRGFYLGTDDNEMDGYFENNSFVGAASSGAGSTEQTGEVSESISYFVETYDDLCALLRTVIKSFPDKFDDVQGAKDDERSILLTTWHSTVKLSGSGEAYLTSGLTNLDFPALWLNEAFKSENFAMAKTIYDSYVTQFKSCNNSCCNFSSSSEKKEKDGGETYLTTFSVNDVNGGYSNKFDDAEVMIELSKDVVDQQWTVELLVWDSSNF